MKPMLILFLFVLLVSFDDANNIEIGEKSISDDMKPPTISCELTNNWKRAKEFTKQYLEVMPEEFYDFKPTPEILSYAQEFLHLACVNYRYAAMIAGGTDCSSYDDIYNDPNLQSKTEIIDFVMDSYDAMIDRLGKEDNLDETTYYYRWSCSKECLAQKGFEHQSHHRGKAAIYLRLKGIAPPSHMVIFDRFRVLIWRWERNIM